MVRIDAKGLACPKPVLLTKDALQAAPEAIEVTVDNAPASQNVSRFMKSRGYEPTIAGGPDIFTVTGKRTAEAKAPSAPAAVASLPNAVFISHKTIGGNDAVLGEVLMKAFLGTLSQFDDNERPAVVALMNEGVKLAVKGSPSAEALQEYANKGGVVLVCGTCLKHFGLMDQLGVGTVSNMFEIASALMSSHTLAL